MIGASDFPNDVCAHFGSARRLQLGGHSTKGDTENIAVM
jgi:hypothetical protein